MRIGQFGGLAALLISSIERKMDPAAWRLRADSKAPGVIVRR